MSLGTLPEYDRDAFEEKKDENKVIRLDLGCGDNKKEGFFGVDISDKVETDLVHDLDNYPYPFDDSSVFEIHCSHFIEHVKYIEKFMDECWRMLIHGGKMAVYAPYYTSQRAIQDFTHKRGIGENTFLYFNKRWRESNKLEHYPVKCNFLIMSTKFMFHQNWVNRADEAKEWARWHHFNAVDDIEVILKAVKK